MTFRSINNYYIQTYLSTYNSHLHLYISFNIFKKNIFLSIHFHMRTYTINLSYNTCTYIQANPKMLSIRFSFSNKTLQRFHCNFLYRSRVESSFVGVFARNILVGYTSKPASIFTRDVTCDSSVNCNENAVGFV